MRQNGPQWPARMGALVALILSVSILSPATVSAAPLPFDFTVTFNSGPLATTEAYGHFTIDDIDFDGVDFEVFTPVGSTFGTDTLLDLGLTIDGHTFTMSDDILFPEFPVVLFLDGDLYEVNFWVFPANGPQLWMAGAGDHQTTVTYTSPVGDQSVGSITYVGPATVPEPASLALLVGGLAVLGAVRRRRTP